MSKTQENLWVSFEPCYFQAVVTKFKCPFEGSNQGLLDFKVGFLRTQFPGNYHCSSSYMSLSSGWGWIQSLDSSDRVVLGLIVINVAVFLLWKVADRQFMTKNFTNSVDNFRSGRVHTLITSAFSQDDHQLLIFNMIGLYLFGISIGRVFGPEFLLMLYLSGAVAGSVFYLDTTRSLSKLLQSKQMLGFDLASIPGLVASGAVNCIMLFDILTHPRYTLYLDFMIPFPAILLGILITRKDLLRIKEVHLGASAHIGGAAVAVSAAITLALYRYLIDLLIP